jgi:hypothetical protein
MDDPRPFAPPAGEDDNSHAGAPPSEKDEGRRLRRWGGAAPRKGRRPSHFARAASGFGPLTYSAGRGPGSSPRTLA